MAAFIAALDASDQEIQTLMLLRHGQVVLEAEWPPYRVAEPHLMFSVSKSFTSVAVGLAIEAGLLSLDDRLVSFFDTDELPTEIGPNLAAMRIRHLLTMTTGHAEDTVLRLVRDERMSRRFLALDVEHEPGTHFVYNTGATYMLSAVLQRLTGERLVDYLRPRLLEPLGATEATWELSPEGISTGGWGLSITTESLARFGQLLLQQGEWEGRPLVPAEWIADATTKQVPNDNQDNIDWQQGYGYQFWRCRYGAYRADGAFGQYCVVFPEQDAVLALTSASPDLQAVLELVWTHLLPAFEGKAPPQAVAGAAEKLEIRPPAGPAPSGGDGKTYRFEPNDVGLVAVRLDPDGTGTFTFDAAGTRREVVCRPGGWKDHGVLQAGQHQLVGPSGRLLTSAHGAGGAFVATFRSLGTPYELTLSCRVEGDKLTVVRRFNVSFAPLELTLTSV